MTEIPVILLAEDLEEDVLIIQRAFKEVYVPHKLMVVQSGDEVRRYLRGDGIYADREAYPFPSLVLLDLKMPGMDGFELLRWLRNTPELSHLRVVVLTSSDHIYDVNKAYQLGANSFLVKPSDFENTLHLAKTLTQHWLVHSRSPSACEIEPPKPNKKAGSAQCPPTRHKRPIVSRRTRLRQRSSV
jgi:CheY-like chemotaxis protein